MRYLFTFLAFVLTVTASAQLTELPITLSMPFDEDTIEETEPVFIWQCNLAALQTDPRLSQRLTVVKLSEEQTPIEGLTLNNPVFMRDELTTSTLAYSATDHQLEDNTWYAWQVSYLMNNMVIGQSEAWKFIRVKPVPPLNSFQPLKDKMDGTIYRVTNDRLNLLLKTNERIGGKGVVTSNSGKQTDVVLEEFTDGEFQQVSENVSKSSLRYISLDINQYDLQKGINTLLWYAGKEQYKLNFIVE